VLGETYPLIGYKDTMPATPTIDCVSYDKGAITPRSHGQDIALPPQKPQDASNLRAPQRMNLYSFIKIFEIGLF